MVWEEHVNNKYLPLHHIGPLQPPVQHDTTLSPWSTPNYTDALTLSFCGLQHTDTEHSYAQMHT